MELYQKRPFAPRWASFENPDAGKGAGGRENRGAKGHPAEPLAPGETKTLLELRGAGIVRRIWLTVSDRSPRALRGIRLDAYWDNAARPAVSAPLGDFFGMGLGRRVPFENALFADPEGRSFVCTLPMPFRAAARIELTNETEAACDHLFYDINLETAPALPDDALYLHAHFRRETPRFGEDYTILPQVNGAGRFIGSNLGLIADERYGGSWWGEGEVKVYLDGDMDLPTLVGTGLEDYLGTAWGQSAFVQRFTGCPVADRKLRQWTFYRYHIPDPIAFESDCRVTVQQIGGARRDEVRTLQQQGAPLQPISLDTGGTLRKLRGEASPPALEGLPDGWVNFYRQDDWSSTAYFYLDRPESELPDLPNVSLRTVGITRIPESLA